MLPTSSGLRKATLRTTTSRWMAHTSGQLLLKIPPSSIIVMDNAPYHSVALEKAPTSSTWKADIQAWLNKKVISWSADLVRAEHLELSKKVSAPALYTGLRAWWLPAATKSCDCLREFNPIGLVWTKVKDCAVSKNKLITLQKIERLLPEALASVIQGLAKLLYLR